MFDARFRQRCTVQNGCKVCAIEANAVCVIAKDDFFRTGVRPHFNFGLFAIGISHIVKRKNNPFRQRDNIFKKRCVVDIRRIGHDRCIYFIIIKLLFDRTDHLHRIAFCIDGVALISAHPDVALVSKLRNRIACAGISRFRPRALGAF